MTAVDERPVVASEKARSRIVLTLQELGIRDAEEQRNVIERTTRGRTRSRAEINPDEASWLIKRLATITPGELAAIARPTGPAPRVSVEPPPPQRTLDPKACLASWDESTPPAPPAVDEPPDEEEPYVERRALDPVAIAAEVALGPLLPLVAPVDQVDDVPPAPEPAPVVEERVNPAWPRPSAEGWTGPVMANGLPNPTGSGRYCLPLPGTCYCGGCPHYVPIPPADSDDYRAQVRGALRQAADKNERKKGGRR